MPDDDKISDAELVRRVAEVDKQLAQLLEARLRMLRLRCIVTPTPQPQPQAVPH